MYHVYLWLAFILFYGLFFWKMGYEILNESKGWFVFLTVVTLVVPISGSFLIEDLKSQISYVSSRNCVYANQTKTSTVYTTVIVNNVPIITPIETTKYLWKCPDGFIWFDVSPKE